MAMENPRRFDPETQHRKRQTKGYVTARYCSECRKWTRPQNSERCECQKKQTKDWMRINTGSCYRGWYEHLDREPVWVDSKADLYRECKKRGLEARALVSGGEMKRPKGA